MEDKKTCTFCRESGCLTTLGQNAVCAACFLSFTEGALEFARRNTVRGSVYRAVFEAVGDMLEKKPEFFMREARDANK